MSGLQRRTNGSSTPCMTKTDREVEQAVRWSVCSGEPFVADFRGVENGDRDRWFHAAGRFEADAGRSGGQLCGIVKYLNP